MKSAFIVFEGIDGSGKGTALKRMKQSLSSRNIPYYATEEPSPNQIGVLTRQFLRKTVEDTSQIPDHLYKRILALLLCADRCWHTQAITSALKAGKVVLCDRYVWSSFAYQSETFSTATLQELNSFLPEPDLILYFKVPTAVALERIKQRGEAAEIFEEERFLKKINFLYDALATSTPSSREIDASLSEDLVYENAWAFVRNFLQLSE